MGCFHPINAWRGTTTDAIYFTPPTGPIKTGFEPVQLPCSKCLGCRMDKARAWALRCRLEYHQHAAASFTTLTYDDKHLPPTLEKRHLQLFLKRLRKAAGPARPLRFFASGEYGEQRGRPHYHAILYGIDITDDHIVEQAWRMGHTRTEHLTDARISYTAGYCQKKIGDPGREHERVDPDTGESYRWKPPFIQMSRRPGIGGHARQWPESWRLYAIQNGHKMPVPRFLHTSWKNQATQEEIDELRAEKKRFALNRDTSLYSLRAAEQIAIRKQAIDADRRKLG